MNPIKKYFAILLTSVSLLSSCGFFYDITYGPIVKFPDKPVKFEMYRYKKDDYFTEDSWMVHSFCELELDGVCAQYNVKKAYEIQNQLDGLSDLIDYYPNVKYDYFYFGNLKSDNILLVDGYTCASNQGNSFSVFQDYKRIDDNWFYRFLRDGGKKYRIKNQVLKRVKWTYQVEE